MIKLYRFLKLGLLILSFLFFLESNRVVGQTILINELLTSNKTTNQDEDGEFSDWIELFNNSSEPINLEGWGLSDNSTNPFKWIFPSLIMEPGDYLLVWASGKNRSPNGYEEGLRLDMYKDIGGYGINDLVSHPKYPGNPDISTIVYNYFEAPSNIGDYYGQRMHGFLKAPVSGNYIFGISGDDHSVLYLSNTKSASDAVKIAEVPGWTNIHEWHKYPAQTSTPISLVEGEYYYLMALMKEDAGGDNLAVRCEFPDGAIEAPMSATYFYLLGVETHTNFSISSAGESIFLTRPDGTLEHSVAAVILPTDVSYGLNLEKSEYVFFKNPTPRAQNYHIGYSEIINEVPLFSHSGGFYTEAFNLTISTTNPEHSIIYTLDGSEPDAANIGGTSYIYKNSYPNGSFLSSQFETHLYSEPIAISDPSSNPYEHAAINTLFSFSTHLPNSNMYKGMVVRAKYYKADALTQASSTHTFFINPLGYNRYELPVVSIAVNDSALFGYYKGIYVAGKVADDYYAQNPGVSWNGGLPANYNQRSYEWERNGHLEYFSVKDQTRYAHEVGIRTHGGWSRANYIKSLRLYARTPSGSGTWFEYPFFGDLPKKGNTSQYVQSFRRVLLRNSGNDYDHTLYRDALMQELVKHLPISTMAYQPVVHFINGEYWGIINMRERYDEYYIQSHFGVNPDDVAILRGGEIIDVGLPQDRDHFLETVSYSVDNNMENSEHFEWVKSRIDIENLANYYAAQIYFYNTDWPQNNISFWRSRIGTYSPSSPSGHDGRWRWLLYDTDFGMNLYDGNGHTQNGLSRIIESANDQSSHLFRQLLLNPEFRSLFINCVSDQLNTCFHPSYINSKIDAFNEVLAGSRAEHWQRWRSGTDNGAIMKAFADQRPSYMRQHLQSGLNLAGTSTLTIIREGGEGLVKVNSVLINNETPGTENPEMVYPWTGIFFKNVPITITAINTPGYIFSHWKGLSGISEYQQTIQVSLESNTAYLTAVFTEAPELDLIHHWHFNNLPTENLESIISDYSQTTDAGTLTYPGFGIGYMDMVTEGSSLNSREVEASLALRVRNPSDTRAVELKVSTTGYKNVVLKYATNRTNSGAEFQNIYYRSSTNDDWVLFKQGIAINTIYQIVEVDFSNIQAANNNPNFEVRIAFSGSNISGTSGNNRFDNITLEGHAKTTNLVADQSQPKILIFPNPATDKFMVKSDVIIKQLQLRNLQGNIILDQSIDAYYATIDISKMMGGLYIVTVQTISGTTMNKLLIK